MTQVDGLGQHLVERRSFLDASIRHLDGGQGLGDRWESTAERRPRSGVASLAATTSAASCSASACSPASARVITRAAVTWYRQAR